MRISTIPRSSESSTSSLIAGSAWRRPESHARFETYRSSKGHGMTKVGISEALIAAAPLRGFLHRQAVSLGAGALRPFWRRRSHAKTTRFGDSEGEFLKKRVLRREAGKSWVRGPRLAAIVARAAFFRR